MFLSTDGHLAFPKDCVLEHSPLRLAPVGIFFQHLAKKESAGYLFFPRAATVQRSTRSIARQTWLGMTRSFVPMGGGVPSPCHSTVAWCSDRAVILASGWSISRPKPLAQAGRSLPRILLPAS